VSLDFLFPLLPCCRPLTPLFSLQMKMVTLCPSHLSRALGDLILAGSPLSFQRQVAGFPPPDILVEECATRSRFPLPLPPKILFLNEWNYLLYSVLSSTPRKLRSPPPCNSLHQIADGAHIEYLPSLLRISPPYIQLRRATWGIE